SYGCGVSPDGSTIVGFAHTPGAKAEVFKWTQAEGIEPVGKLRIGSFDAGAWAATTFSGRIIVGMGSTASGAEAFLYTAANGMQNLRVVLVSRYGLGRLLNGWKLSGAYAISSDGRYIVGDGTNPHGEKEAWLADLRRPQGGLL